MEIKNIDGYVRGISNDAEETRTVEFVISTSDRDRHKTVLNPKKWDLKGYKLNPVVGYQHHLYGDDFSTPPNPDDIIGTSKVWVEDDKLIGAVTFEPADENPLAEKIFKKVLRGTLRTASVGFLPIENKDGEDGKYGKEDDGEQKDGPNETFYYNGQELLEWSIVNIPSNAKAGKRIVRHNIANALMFVKRELGFRFADIEKMTVGEVIEMLENPGKEYKKIYTPELIEEMVREALGDKYDEKLTLKGLFSVLRGGDAEDVEEADTGQEVDQEARDKHIRIVKKRQEAKKRIAEFLIETQ